MQETLEQFSITEENATQPQKRWVAPKLTKHGDIASLTKQWPGPDGLLPNGDGRSL